MKQRITITATGDLEKILAVEQRLHPLTLAEVLVHPGLQGRDGDVLGRLDAIAMVQARTHRVDVHTFDTALARAAAALET